MSYPKVTINLDIIKNNVKTVIGLKGAEDIKFAGVTKAFCANPTIAQAYIDGGVSYLADSRIENLMKLKDVNIPKIMLRLPMKSEIDKIVEYADISLNSSLEIVKLLSEKAIEKNKVHNIILMFDLGDLREGYFEEESLFNDLEEIVNLKGIKLLGLGTNLTCYGGVIPCKETLERLAELQNEAEKRFDIKLEILAGGNSSTVHLLADNKIERMNLLRIGESFLLGTESAYGQQLEGTRNDAFHLEVEVIEVNHKPSLPIGKIGRDAFGNIPTFVDRGVRKRILCAVGKQDVDFDTLFPTDKDLIILGGSSDHIIIDGSDSEIDYKVGDIIKFRMNYVSILRAMTSEYIEKEIIG